MKIEVKNIKTNMAFSEETICFKADIYVDGKKVMYAENNGHGEMTYIAPYGIEHKQIYQDAVKYLSGIAKDEYAKEYPLVDLVDELIDNHVNEKERKKFINKRNKDAEKYLVIYKDDEYSYSRIDWGKHTIEQLLKVENGRQAIKNSVTKYRNIGYKIFNTNIPSEILN